MTFCVNCKAVFSLKKKKKKIKILSVISTLRVKHLYPCYTHCFNGMTEEWNERYNAKAVCMGGEVGGWNPHIYFLISP